MKISVPRRLALDELQGKYEDDVETIIGAIGDFQDGAVAAVNGALTVEDNTTSKSAEYTLKHNVETRIRNPLGGVPKGVWAVKCIGVEVSNGKPTRKLYSLSVPRIDWEPADNDDGKTLLVTAFYPGNIGQETRSAIALASAVYLSTATAKTITSISLTAGSWDVSALALLNGNLTGTAWVAGISATTDAIGATGDKQAETPTVSTTAADSALVVPQYRLSLTATTTEYLTCRAVFTVGTAKAYGRISAVRTAIDPSTTGRVRLFFFGG